MRETVQNLTTDLLFLSSAVEEGRQSMGMMTQFEELHQSIVASPPSLPLPPVVKPSSISKNIEPKFHSQTTLSTQAITKKGCMGAGQHDCVEPNVNNQENLMTSSYVAFTDTDVINNQIIINPINTVFDASRLIGRGFSDSFVHGDMNLWSFKVFPSPCDKPMINATYKGEEKQFAAEEISPMILIKMRESQVIHEGLKSGKGHELEHCFSGVDKRVRDKGGGRTFQLGNNPKEFGRISDEWIKEVCQGEFDNDLNILKGFAGLDMDILIGPLLVAKCVKLKISLPGTSSGFRHFPSMRKKYQCPGYVLQSGIGSWDFAVVSCNEYLGKSSFWDEILKDSSEIIGIVNLVLASAPKFPSEYELQRMWYYEKNIGLLKINQILHSWYFPVLNLSIIVIDVESVMVSHFHKYEPDNAWLEFLRRKLKAIVPAFHSPDCTSVFVQDIDAFAPYGPRHIEFNSCDPIADYLKQYLLKHDVKIFQNITIAGFRSGKELKCKLKMFFDSWESTYVCHSIEEVTLFNSLIKSWSLKVLKSEYQSLSVQKSRLFPDYKTENERAIVWFGVVETLPSFNEVGVLSLHGFSVWSVELLYESRNMGKEIVTQLLVDAMFPYILWGPNKVNISTPREILIKFLDMIQPPISSKLVAFQTIPVCFQVNWYDPQYWKKCGYISLDLVASKTPIELKVPNLVLEVILSKNMTLQLVLAEKTIIGILGKPTLFYVSSLVLDLVSDNYGREWRWITWLLKIVKKDLARQKLIWPFKRIITCGHEGIISAPELYKQGACYFYASEYMWLQRYLQSIIHQKTTSAALFCFVFVKCDSLLKQPENFLKSCGELGSLIGWNNWQGSQVVHGIAALKIILVHVATAVDVTFVAIFGMSLSLKLEVKLQLKRGEVVRTPILSVATRRRLVPYVTRVLPDMRAA